MKSMTLLKAMSEIDPADIEGAMNAGKGGAGEPEISDAESEGHGRVILHTAGPEPSAGRHLRFGGWIAVAACLTLAVGAAVFFRQDRGNYVMTHSMSEEVAEVTAETTAATAASEEVQTTAVTVINPQMEAETETAEQAPVHTEAEQDGNAAQTEPTEAAETQTAQETTTTAAVTYPAEIPALVAMADEAGTLTHPDGTAFADGEAELTKIEGAGAVQNYLDSPSPKVTLGEGQKDAATAAAILQDPVLYRIRWQIFDARGDSYGISSAEIDADGVLHLQISMYSDGTEKPQPDWIYETALLSEAGTIPQITDVRLELTFYTDTDGIVQWLRYTESLEEDVYIRNLS